MYILRRRIDPQPPLPDLPQQSLESIDQPHTVGGWDDPTAAQHLGVRDRADHINARQTEIHGDARDEALHQRIRPLRKPSTPQLPLKTTQLCHLRDV
jgi:hypothetical protein